MTQKAAAVLFVASVLLAGCKTTLPEPVYEPEEVPTVDVYFDEGELIVLPPLVEEEEIYEEIYEEPPPPPPVITVAPPPPPEEPPPAIDSFEGERYYVQVASYRNAAAAQSEIARINNGLPVTIKTAYVTIKGERMLVHRVLIGPVDYYQSNDILNMFKTTYQDAFVWPEYDIAP